MFCTRSFYEEFLMSSVAPSEQAVKNVTIIAVLVVACMPMWMSVYGDMLFVLVAFVAAVTTGIHAARAHSCGYAMLALAWMLGVGIRLPYISNATPPFFAS